MNITREEFFKEWVGALRSDEYEQGRGRLRRKGGVRDSYCCLGVACQIAEEHGGGNWYFNFEDKWRFKTPHSDTFLVLPDDIQKFLEINEVQSSKLMQINDSAEKNFAQIADYIEKEFLSL